MRNKLIFMIFISILLVSLSACQGKGEEGLVIESSSVEFGSAQDRDDRELHFRVQISDYGNEPELDYKIRFIIQDTHIRDLIGTETIEVPDTYILPGSGLVTGSSVEFKKEFSIDEIRKTIEKGKAVIVELYDEDQVIAREVIKIFRENIKEIVKINPQVKIDTIDLKEANEIAIFRRAVNDSTKVQGGTIYYINPKYQFNLGEESFYLWITEDEGRIMNTNDTYTIYSLSDSSLKEIKEFIEKSNTNEGEK